MKKRVKITKKSHVISTRINSDELHLLEMKARSSNKRISDLMREALFVIASPEGSYTNS